MRSEQILHSMWQGAWFRADKPFAVYALCVNMTLFPMLIADVTSCAPAAKSLGITCASRPPLLSLLEERLLLMRP